MSTKKASYNLREDDDEKKDEIKAVKLENAGKISAKVSKGCVVCNPHGYEVGSPLHLFENLHRFCLRHAVRRND